MCLIELLVTILEVMLVTCKRFIRLSTGLFAGCYTGDMTTYVALIRGIGPGDPRKSNESLRGALEKLGFTNVTSVISSGNVIFQSKETNVNQLEDTIEAGWPRLLGFEATTIVRSEAQLQKIIDTDPFDGATHSNSSYLLVTFFRKNDKAWL